MVVFLGLVALMSLNSCQKDEDLIVGKWECTKTEKECGSHVYYSSSGLEHTCYATMSGLWVGKGDIWSFDADGTMNHIVTEFWNINEDVLNISDQAFTIEKLTSSEMILVGKKRCYNDVDYHWYRLYFKKI